MESDKDFESFQKSDSDFGTGFILGALFASLAVFFLATKTGRALIKKLEPSSLNLEKLDQFLAQELAKLTNDGSSHSNGDSVSEAININSQPGRSQSEDKTLKPTIPSTLGRRFFHRKKLTASLH